MNPESEQKKIAAILESGQFEWRGVVWQVDPVATKDHYLNANLAGKPLMKLVGVGTHGEVVSVWSHDVSAVDIPVAAVEVPEYVVDDTANVEFVPVQDDDGEPKTEVEPVFVEPIEPDVECESEPTEQVSDDEPDTVEFESEPVSTDDETEPDTSEEPTPPEFLECNAKPSKRGRKKTTLKKERL